VLSLEKKVEDEPYAPSACEYISFLSIIRYGLLMVFYSPANTSTDEQKRLEKIKRNEQRLKAMGLDKPLIPIPKPKPKKRLTVTKGSELKVAIIVFLSKTLILLPNPQRVSAKPSRSSKRRKTNHQIIITDCQVMRAMANQRRTVSLNELRNLLHIILGLF
jgi:hypothetical protein